MVSRLILALLCLGLLFNNCSRVSFSSLDGSSSGDESQEGYSLSGWAGGRVLGPIKDPVTGQPIIQSGPQIVANSYNEGADNIGSSGQAGSGSVGGTGSSSISSSSTCATSSTVSQFNIVSRVEVSSVYNYSGKFDITVSEQDLNKSKKGFLAATISGLLYIYNFRTSQFIEASKASSSGYADFGFSLPNEKCKYPYQILEFKNADLVAYGGSIIYAGYGIGETASAAAADMMSFRDASHFQGRFHQLYTVPQQPASVSFLNMGYSNTSLNGSANVFVRNTDYNKNGFYFLAAISGDQKTKFMYTGTSWIEYNGSNFAALGGKQQLKNQSITFKADVTNSQIAGYSLYAGYAVAENIGKAFEDFVSNAQNTRNTVPYVLKENPSQQKDPNNYNIQATVSGPVSRYNLSSTIKIADAHIDQTGYILVVGLYAGSYYVHNPNTKEWKKWDGTLANFATATPLKSQSFATTLAANLDVTALGGTILYVGYGLGNNPALAVKEMLDNVRWKEIATIPSQSFSSSTISIPSYSKTSGALVEMDFRIYPNYQDYNTFGKYYIVLVSPDESQKAVYSGSVFSSSLSEGLVEHVFSNPTSWNLWSPEQSDSLFTLASPGLHNFRTRISIKGTDLANFSGYKLFVGYGKSINDMLAKGTHTAGTLIP